MDTLKVADVLRKALEVFGPNGENWAQGDKAMSKPYCCVTLAFSRIRTQDYMLVSQAQDVLYATMGLKTNLPWLQAERWNDAPERTWPEVKAAFEQAITEAEKPHA